MITDAGCVSRLDGTRRRPPQMVGPRLSADVLSWRDPVRRPANARRLWTTLVGTTRSRLRRLRRHRLLSNVSEKCGVVKAESLPEVGTPPLDHREDTRRNMPHIDRPSQSSPLPGFACAREGYISKAGTANAAFQVSRGLRTDHALPLDIPAFPTTLTFSQAKHDF